MATYIKGDIHGDLSEITNFIDRFELNENDTIIVVGDFGLYWRHLEETNKVLAEYDKLYKTKILWLDGNHENFELIENLPDAEGTPFKKCSELVYYIPRGTVFEIDTDDGIKTCLACGGADSVDKFKRIKGWDWWTQEQISEDDIARCIKNAEAVGHIDYVFSHCCPLSVFQANAPWLITILGLDKRLINHTSEERLDTLIQNIDFSKYFFGHYHIDKVLDEKYTCVYHDFIRL